MSRDMTRFAARQGRINTAADYARSRQRLQIGLGLTALLWVLILGWPL